MIFRNRSLKGIFGQSMSDLPSGSLTGASRSQQSATLKATSVVHILWKFTGKFTTLIFKEVCDDICPRRVLAQRPKPEEAL